jgi:hypothetical protein
VGIVALRRDIMAGEKSVTEKILNVLRPYAAHWGGTLGRGKAGAKHQIWTSSRCSKKAVISPQSKIKLND